VFNDLALAIYIEYRQECFIYADYRCNDKGSHEGMDDGVKCGIS